MTASLSLMNNVIVPLAKRILISLGWINDSSVSN